MESEEMGGLGEVSHEELAVMRETGTERAQGGTRHAIVELEPRDGQADIHSGSIYFIGTATILIRYAGFTILTDPNFLHRGEYAYLGYGLRSRRLTDPAIPLHGLPPFDFVLLSHLHEDHFDRRVEAELEKNTRIVTTPKAAGSLQRKGFLASTGLGTWDSLSFSRSGIRLRITSMPGRHGPPLLSWLMPPVMGSMLEFSRQEQVLLRMYITGDTLVYDGLREIAKRYGSPDHAILHLGGTRILGLLLTMDAKQGIDMLKLVEPKIAIPIHYNDYTVFRSPLSEFQEEVHKSGRGHAVRYLRHGETYRFDVPAPQSSAM
jgi:L-ascorbate metabolism protein UlaG (beta-lactamase superfamily)